MRIVGGKYRGRRLAAPSGNAVRPTGDRLREALFNILAHGAFPDLAGAGVLDAFAGTGAFGLEALSRGAARATFIDHDVQSVRRNAAALAEDNVVLIAGDALAPPPAPRPVPLAFLDPPYGLGLAGPALTALRIAGWIDPATSTIVETAREEVLDVPSGFTVSKRRRHGSSQLVFLEVSAGR